MNPDKTGFFVMKNIILLHGAIGASDQLYPLSLELKGKGYECFTLDFSGHGKKTFTNGFGIAAFSDELESFIESNNLKQPHVFGYSMGGFVALYLASKRHDLIGRIITLGTKFEWSPEIAAKEIKMLDSQTISEKVPKFAEALQKRHGDKWKLLLKNTAEMMLELGKNNVLSEKEFAKISNRVLLGLAENDSMVSVEETNFAASKIKNSQRFELKETKHPIETINTKYLSELIKQFIEA